MIPAHCFFNVFLSPPTSSFCHFFCCCLTIWALLSNESERNFNPAEIHESCCVPGGYQTPCSWHLLWRWHAMHGDHAGSFFLLLPTMEGFLSSSLSYIFGGVHVYHIPAQCVRVLPEPGRSRPLWEPRPRSRCRQPRCTPAILCSSSSNDKKKLWPQLAHFCSSLLRLRGGPHLNKAVCSAVCRCLGQACGATATAWGYRRGRGPAFWEGELVLLWGWGCKWCLREASLRCRDIRAGSSPAHWIQNHVWVLPARGVGPVTAQGSLCACRRLWWSLQKLRPSCALCANVSW